MLYFLHFYDLIIGIIIFQDQNCTILGLRYLKQASNEKNDTKNEKNYKSTGIAQKSETAMLHFLHLFTPNYMFYFILRSKLYYLGALIFKTGVKLK